MHPTRLAFQGVFTLSGSLCTEYTGTNGIREFTALAGCPADTPPPVVNPGCGSWDETCMKREIMTQFLDSGSGPRPLSKVTIAAMEDVGYTVDYTKADAFGSGDLGSCTCNSRRLNTDNETSFASSSVFSPRPGRRRLSDAGYEAATAFGRSEMERVREATEGSSAILPLVSVLYQDTDGSIYSVFLDD